MRVISLYQPYATLVVLGLKQFETRGWDTKVRGPLAIHATVGFSKWAKEACEQEPFKSALAQHGYAAANLPTGAILGVVELVNTQPSEQWIQARTNFLNLFMSIWENERAFGDYSPGRFAWELQNPKRFTSPILAKGSQGFWKFDIPESARFQTDADAWDDQRFAAIADVKVIEVGNLCNWPDYQDVIKQMQRADGFIQASIEATDWNFIREEFYNNDFTAKEAFKGMFYEE